MPPFGTTSGAHPDKPKERPDAQSHAHPCDRTAVRRIGGSHRRRANLARGQSHRRCCAELHADRTGGLPRMGTLLPTWIRPHVRSVSMLVSSLLVNRGAKGGAVALAARHRAFDAFDVTRHHRTWVTSEGPPWSPNS